MAATGRGNRAPEQRKELLLGHSCSSLFLEQAVRMREHIRGFRHPINLESALSPPEPPDEGRDINDVLGRETRSKERRGDWGQ